MMHLQNERGVVGLAILGVALVMALAGAGYYVYQVRSGEAEPITATILPRASTPAEIKADPDASAADEAGQAADTENLNDMDISDAELE